MMDVTLILIEKRLKEKIVDELTKAGLLFRIFSRIKELESIGEKVKRKKYSKDDKLMQDLIGLRITTYFIDDVEIAVKICEKVFNKVDMVYDRPGSEVFSPVRKNMTCKMPSAELKYFTDMKSRNNDYDLMDSTFEIQFRTTFSEGWHEIDHLMRYKCKPDWEDLSKEGRMLNGIYASLETNDQVLRSLFDDISYQHYRSKKWEAMLRNKFRLRFSLKSIDIEINEYINKNPKIGKEIFKLDRGEVMNCYIDSNLSFPVTIDNWLYFINYFFLKDKFILSKTSEALLERLKGNSD